MIPIQFLSSKIKREKNLLNSLFKLEPKLEAYFFYDISKEICTAVYHKDGVFV